MQHKRISLTLSVWFQAIMMSICLQSMVDELMVKKSGGSIKKVGEPSTTADQYQFITDLNPVLKCYCITKHVNRWQTWCIFSQIRIVRLLFCSTAGFEKETGVSPQSRQPASSEISPPTGEIGQMFFPLKNFLFTFSFFYTQVYNANIVNK